jgi:ubiquitin-protein ligase
MYKLEKVKDIFILDDGSVYDTSQSSPGSRTMPSQSSQTIIIKGCILPKLEPYCQRSFRIRFTLTPSYPFKYPKLHFLDHMYHPNIDSDGRFCSRLVNDYDSYNPVVVSISDINKNVEQLKSSFDEEFVINKDVYINNTKTIVMNSIAKHSTSPFVMVIFAHKRHSNVKTIIT